jgi:hypothetical protein
VALAFYVVVSARNPFSGGSTNVHSDTRIGRDLSHSSYLTFPPLTTERALWKARTPSKDRHKDLRRRFAHPFSCSLQAQAIGPWRVAILLRLRRRRRINNQCWTTKMTNQQRLNAWHPILDPVFVIVALFYLGVIMVPVGMLSIYGVGGSKCRFSLGVSMFAVFVV